MIYKKLFLITILAVFIFNSCDKDEDVIIPKEDLFSFTRFSFPQGYTESDEIIERIYDEFNVRIVYNDLDSIDFFKTWVAPASPDGKRVWNVKLLSRDTIFKLVDVLDNRFFKYLPTEIGKHVFPKYIYLADDFKNIYNNAFSTYVPFDKINLSTFWIVAPPSFIYVSDDYVIDDKYRENASINAYMKSLIFGFIARAYRFKLIAEPEGLNDQSDFSVISNEDIKKIDSKIISPEDYVYGQRGVLLPIYGNAIDLAKPNFGQKPTPPAPPSYYSTALTAIQANNLSSVVQNILYRTPEVFKAKFGKYDKIMYQYNLVVKHFKENYNIDLEQISRDLEVNVDHL